MAADFLCIGAPRAGTTWFARNLCSRPEVVALPIKELRYFGDNPWTAKAKLRRMEFLLTNSPKQEWQLKWFKHWVDTAENSAGYLSLFDMAPAGITGDFSPSYCAATMSQIREAFNILGKIPIFAFLRDPIERDWSHLRFVSRSWVGSLEENKEQAISFIRSDFVRVRSDYASFLDRWGSVFEVTPFFFEDIKANPGRILNTAWERIGLTDISLHQSESTVDKIINPAPLLELPDWIRAELIELNRETIFHIRERYGGHAKNWDLEL